MTTPQHTLYNINDKVNTLIKMSEEKEGIFEDMEGVFKSVNDLQERVKKIENLLHIIIQLLSKETDEKSKSL